MGMDWVFAADFPFLGQLLCTSNDSEQTIEDHVLQLPDCLTLDDCTVETIKENFASESHPER